MYAVTTYEIGDLRGPFYLDSRGGWTTALYGGFTHHFETIQEASKIASQYKNASVIEV